MSKIIGCIRLEGNETNRKSHLDRKGTALSRFRINQASELEVGRKDTGGGSEDFVTVAPSPKRCAKWCVAGVNNSDSAYSLISSNSGPSFKVNAP
jgi:hypothetical protein